MARGRRRRPTLDLDRPADEPLAPAEVAQMVAHLAFLRRYKRQLRLRLNASESLLVDGQRPPEHRGRCKHLLSKVDRATLQAALSRGSLATDPAARATFLAGAATLTGDLGVLLDSLEAASAVQSDRALRRTVHDAIAQLDASRASAARLRRLLDLLDAAYGDEAPHVAFSLLGNASFRDALGRHADDLDAERFLAPRAVHAALRGHTDDPRLDDGLRLLVTTDGFAGHARRQRERLVQLALARGGPLAPDAPGVRAVLHDRRTDGGLRAELHRARGEALLRHGRFDEAAEVLARTEADPTLVRWLQRPRVGPIAVHTRVAGPIVRGYDLRHRRDVLVRLLDANAYARTIAAQDEATVPAVVPLADHGVDGALAWFLPASDAPLFGEALAANRMLTAPQALELAAEGARLLHALALAGHVVDADPARFLLGRVLLLADLSGAEPGRDALPAARQWSTWCLQWPPFSGAAMRELPGGFAASLEAAVSTPELVRLLDAARLQWRSDA
jgi:hypothetical protein